MSNEANIINALEALKRDPKLSVRRASKIFNVPHTTIHYRQQGVPARRDIPSKSRKLTDLEEQTVVRYILDLDSRSFPPRKSGVEDMANRLLELRGGERVGVNWVTNFVRRHPEIQTRLTRRIDYQRIKCEDPDIYQAWFILVRRTIEEAGIQESDIYNFDETGFVMGMISSEMVVTSSDRTGRPRQAQQGNREWATVIQAVGSYGYVIPPYIIVAGQNHLSSWYENSPFPPDWTIAVTKNGWTTNERGLDWIQHFDQHTKSRTKGAKRLLIMDGHESHHSTDFELYCTDHGIITLCMPAHSSHKLQPLDVGCFRALKRAYSKAIEGLMRTHITHISKEDFFTAFHTAHIESITESNIRGGFRGAGLVPYDPEYVISQLNTKFHTPTPPGTSSGLPALWDPKTPNNPIEAQSQTDYIKNRIVRHQNSSPTSIIESLYQFAKGTTKVMHELALLRGEVRELRKANEILSRRRRTKRKRLQDGGSLTQAEAENLQSQIDVSQQLQEEDRTSRGRKRRVNQRAPRCRTCGEPGHNSRTCQNYLETSSEEDSE
jgi:hypothetical protein